MASRYQVEHRHITHRGRDFQVSHPVHPMVATESAEAAARLADGDEDLGMVILCIEDGISEPRNIIEMPNTAMLSSWFCRGVIISGAPDVPAS